jgi:hypothetical protein
LSCKSRHDKENCTHDIHLKQRNEITGGLQCRKSNDNNETELQHGNCFSSSQNPTDFISQYLEIITQWTEILTSSLSEVQSVTKTVLLASGTEDL